MKNSYLIRSPKTASRLVLGETVVVLLPRGEMSVLNESASILWSLLDGSIKATDLSEEIRTAYKLDSLPDLEPVLDALISEGLVEASDEPVRSARISPDAPAPTEYSPPRIKARELLETLAGGCPSAFDGQPWTGDCRSDYMTCDVITGS